MRLLEVGTVQQTEGFTSSALTHVRENVDVIKYNMKGTFPVMV